MAAATSPYQRNDYQALSTYMPYKLPVNEIFKAISAQNMFWEQGAARVKNVYQDALGLKLSLEPNKQIRDEFMKGAEKQLTKLSAMDLADASVQKQGMNLFKPLFQDEGILYDDLTTRHYDKVRSDALNFRQKDNGKGYSDINFAYAMDGYNDFVNSTDRMAGKTFYGKRREYTPYYDYTSDFDKALKNCKPSSISATSPQGDTDYSLTESSKFLSASQARLCIDAGLSSQGQRQLQIEGAVNYRNNKEVLADDVVDYLGSIKENYSQQLQALSAQKQALSDPKSELGSKLKPEQRNAAIAQIDEQIAGITDEISDNDNVIGKLRNKDYRTLDENYDGYAGSVFTYKKLYRKSLAAAFEEQNKEYKADPIKMMYRKFAQDQYLNNLDYQHDVSLEQMKENHATQMKYMELMYGGKDGKKGSGAGVHKNPMTGEWEITGDIQWETPPIYDGPDKDKNVYSKIQGELADLNKKDATSNLELYNNIIERGENDKQFRSNLLKGFNYEDSDTGWNKFKSGSRDNTFRINNLGRNGGIQETSWFNTYFQMNKEDGVLNDWAKKNSEVNTAIGTLKMKLDVGEKQVAKELGIANIQEELQKNIKTIKPVMYNGRLYTAQDMQNALEGKPANGLTVQTEKFERDLGNRGLSISYEKTIKINGKDDPSGNINALYAQVKGINETLNNKVSSKRKEVYDRLGFNRERWAIMTDDDNDIVKKIQYMYPVGENENQLNKAIAIIGSDFSGGIKVTIPWASKGSSNDLAKLRKLGIGDPDKIEIPQNGVVIFRGTTYNSIPQAVDNPMLADAAYQLSNIASTTAFQTTQPGARVPDSDIKVPVYISGKRQTMTIRTYNTSSGQPQFRAYMEGANTSEPQAIANNAYDLFEKLAKLRINYNQPVR